MATMKRVNVGMRPDAAKSLASLSRRKRCSKGGLVSLLVQIANGERPDLGIIDLSWDRIQKECPNMDNRNKKTWAALVVAVAELAKEFDTPEEISLHSRFTVAQCRRALEELRG